PRMRRRRSPRARPRMRWVSASPEECRTGSRGRLHAQQAAHRPRIAVTGTAAVDDPALLHHEVAGSEAPRELEVLLDEQDRDAELAADPAERLLDLEDDRRLDAFGRLV